ncbi:MAG: hypothetical protein RMY16_08470 [Nostoc sp. DedQUE12b]|uniref:hypothetical protein n=1 Tax=Nostoc sp. DedQUE12b TaxID=3075398 RepID=UPI002AD2B893|nr:hypothetical protein [Nostoc sp. DedQUE12b]MDZ8085616.1 hypothetical protein [Nostoc sp. DedQUE12b]
MAYCSGKSKAVIAVTSNGETIKYIVSNPPVDVTLIQKHVSVVTGEGLNLDNCGGLNNYGSITYDGYVEMVGITVNACSGSKPSVDGVLSPGTNDVYYPPTVLISRSLGDWELTITNTEGVAHKIRYPTKPIYEVSCDDDCPEGSHKCTHNKYPGYCCVPCKEMGDRLKNMANKVGR